MVIIFVNSTQPIKRQPRVVAVLLQMREKEVEKDLSPHVQDNVMIKPQPSEERILQLTSEVLNNAVSTSVTQRKQKVLQLNKPSGRQVINHRRQNSTLPCHLGFAVQNDRLTVCRDQSMIMDSSTDFSDEMIIAPSSIPKSSQALGQVILPLKCFLSPSLSFKAHCHHSHVDPRCLTLEIPAVLCLNRLHTCPFLHSSIMDTCAPKTSLKAQTL